MTLEGIHEVYDDAYWSYQRGGLGPWSTDNAERYALRKVFEALQPKLELYFYAISQDVTEKTARAFAEGFVDTILASDGVERHPTTGNPVGTDTVAGRHPAADPAAYHGAVPQVPNGAYREMTVGYTPAALAEAGLVIVPRVPTEKMLAAAHDGPLGAAGEVMGVEQATWLAEMYRAMIGAEMTTDAQIKRMVEKFLCWELPIDFNPDNGITFDPIGSRGTPYEFRRQPVGTNLLTAQQAEAMIRHILAEAANEQ